MNSNVVSKMKGWYDRLTGHVPGTVRSAVASAYSITAGRVTRLLYGEDIDVWHDARDDTGRQEEETFHDARDIQARVTEAIRRGVSIWEIPGNNNEGPSVFLDRTQDEVRRVVTEVPGTKKVNTILECEMVREDLSTGEQIFAPCHARSKVHVVHDNFDDENVTMRGEDVGKPCEVSERGKWLATTFHSRISCQGRKARAARGKCSRNATSEETRGKKGHR